MNMDENGHLPSPWRQVFLLNPAGQINSITRKWMDSGMKETPEEMIDYIMSFILLL